MRAIHPDMLRAARSHQGSGRPRVLQAGQAWKDSPIMAQPAPATVAVTVDQLRSIQKAAFNLSVRVSLVLEECGLDLTCPTPSTIPAGADVIRLSDFRDRRQAVQQ